MSSPKVKHKRNYLTSLTLLLLVLAGCKETEVVPKKSPDQIYSEHLTFGNPSNATTDISNSNNYLMGKPQYALSYSRNRGTPNWVSWHLTQDWMGSVPRQDDFSPDSSLPIGWYRVTASSYTGSVFDRGHNTPSADRTRSFQDNSASFLMPNMIPQASNYNQQTWARLEDYTRDLVQDGNEVYVIMGSYGVGGTGSMGAKNTIDNGRVTVPSQIWKVKVILPEGEDDVSRITSSTRVIAVNTLNINSINSSWGSYRTSVDAIEAETGYNLLSVLPDNIEQVLEAKTDTGPTQ
ncbi:DNA/RNA non-specific endonuclease [Rufibacter latericius]|uniref:DNA/RNA non-specific endonuclease n=1 Tax=Rufibacter latericius TaxID=2487040 RepID=A0A3M9MUA1_9BACT|nr:DNA/RNA non-specific endonuclease [Rufibacter latericius]RNI29086.1 DNA/RNA non-specific endonuclease [Rufibacter latericius]